MKIFGKHPITRTHIASPSQEQIQEIVDTYDLHAIVEEDLLTGNTQDKIDVYDDHVFLVIHLPKYDPAQKKYYANEMAFVITKEVVVSFTKYPTSHMQQIQAEFQQALEDKKHDDKIVNSVSFLVYRILDAFYDKIINHLNKFTKDLNTVEEKLFVGHNLKSQLLSDLLIKRRNSIFLKHLLQPQGEIIAELQKSITEIESHDADVYFEDLEYKFDKILHTISVVSENTESLANTYNALANIQTNSVISILTIFTVIIGLMTMITGFYGMNISLPGQDNPQIFTLMVGIMILAGALVLLYAKKKKWW